jgi:hypothetical protein
MVKGVQLEPVQRANVIDHQNQRSPVAIAVGVEDWTNI